LTVFRVGRQGDIQLNNIFPSILENKLFEFTARWILGLIFIYAGYHKIIAPEEFAKLVYGYGLFPNELINLIAIIIPFIELLTGLLLISGRLIHSATLMIITLLILFILLISINLIRGYEFDCGCFAANDFFSSKTPWKTLTRDVVLLLLGGYVYRFKSQRWVFHLRK
jgi:putative oxidoreductase